MSAVTVSLSDGIGYLTLTRPTKSNAIDHSMAADLLRAVRSLAGDDRARVVMISGEGRSFCVGGDVGAMVEADDRSTYLRESADTLDQALQVLTSMDKPVVAAVHGAVAGAGLALMLSCDLVVADVGARFIGAYRGVGLTPDCGLSWLLPRAVGQQRALELLLTSRVLTAAEAQEWGMVTILAEDPFDRAADLVLDLATGPAPALGRIRRLIRDTWDRDRMVTGTEESRVIALTSSEPETERLLSRFEKR